MKASTRARIAFAQCLLMLSYCLLGAYVIRDNHWPGYLYGVNAVITAMLGFLIPTEPEAYQKED